MFYVAHRLFAAHDRALGALAAQRLAAQTGADNVFLPFCDTDEEDLVADLKGRRLFELDTQRLASLRGMLAILHGPSLDDGVCMEIGYAAATGVPVVALTTDFTTYGLTEHGPRLHFPDPLIHVVAADIVHAGKLGAPTTDRDPYTAFTRRNTDQVAAAIDHAVTRLCELAETHSPSASAPTHRPTGPVAFCEPSPYWHDNSWTAHSTHLRQLGYRTHTATRLDSPDPLSAATADWASLATAQLLVADVCGPETPPGAAVMIGAFAATGRPILAHQPRPAWTFADGREPNRRNLMIQYAVREWFTDLSALPRPTRT